MRTSPQCLVPDMMTVHQRWRSISQDLSIIIDDNKESFSFLKSGTLLEQVTCHSRQKDMEDSERMVAHVKAGW